MSSSSSSSSSFTFNGVFYELYYITWSLSGNNDMAYAMLTCGPPCMLIEMAIRLSMVVCVTVTVMYLVYEFGILAQLIWAALALVINTILVFRCKEKFTPSSLP